MFGYNFTLDTIIYNYPLYTFENDTRTWDDNSTVNGYPLPPKWALVTLIVFPLWILTGNLLVLVAVARFRKLRTLSNLVIASLAFTDFLLAILVVPLGIYQTVVGYWDLGLIVCLVWTGCDVFLSTTSIMHLCAIAIYRYYGISHPLLIRSSQTKRHVLGLLIPAWTISAAIAAPLIIRGSIAQSPVMIGNEMEGYLCGIFDQTFAIYSSLVSFFIPLAIMIVADMRSVQVLRKSVGSKAHSSVYRTRAETSDSNSRVQVASKSEYSRSEAKAPNGIELTTASPQLGYRMRACSTIYEEGSTKSDQEGECVEISFSTQTTPLSDLTPASDIGVGASVVPTPCRQGSKGKKPDTGPSISDKWVIRKVNSREQRAKRTLIWVFVCFVVFWLPFFVTNFTYGVCRLCDIPGDVFAAFTWLGYISSGVNPCLYTYLNKDFRFAFKKILLCGYYSHNKVPVAPPSSDRGFALNRSSPRQMGKRVNSDTTAFIEKRAYSSVEEDSN